MSAPRTQRGGVRGANGEYVNLAYVAQVLVFPDGRGADGQPTLVVSPRMAYDGTWGPDAGPARHHFRDEAARRLLDLIAQDALPIAAYESWG